MEIDKLLSGLVNPQLWLVLAAASAVGAVGALIHRLSQDPPPSNGAWRDVLMGGIAAIAALYVTNPVSGVALIGGSLVAGYAGKLVLAGLEARLTATLAFQEAAHHRAAATQARKDLDSLAMRVTALPAPTASSIQDPSSIADVQRFARDIQARHAIA